MNFVPELEVKHLFGIRRPVVKGPDILAEFGRIVGWRVLETVDARALAVPVTPYLIEPTILLSHNYAYSVLENGVTKFYYWRYSGNPSRTLTKFGTRKDLEDYAWEHLNTRVASPIFRRDATQTQKPNPPLQN